MTPEQLAELGQYREQAYEVIDEWCEMAVAQEGTGCRLGCSECCQNVVTVSLIEAAVILQADNGQRIFKEKRDRIVAFSKLFLSRDPVTKLKPWRKLNEPCLFLGDDSRCEIYEDRPFNCRTHIAIKPCVPEQDGNLYIDPLSATRLGYEMADYAEKYTGIPNTVAPLAVALVIADAIIRADIEEVKKAYAGTPLLDPLGSLQFWSYIEME